MSMAIPGNSRPSLGSSRHAGKTIKLKTFLQSKGTLSPGKRKSLQQLQPAAGDSGKLVGKDGFIRSQKPRTPKRKRDGDNERPSKKQAMFITKPTKKFSIFKDQDLPENKMQSKNKTPEEIAHELMVQEDVPEKYWEELAEERRVALENTLEENEQLHHEVTELKEENAKLKVTADQAVYLAEVVQNLLGEEDEEADDNESKDCDRIEDDTQESDQQDESSTETDDRLASQDELRDGETTENRSGLQEEGSEQKPDNEHSTEYEREQRLPSWESNDEEDKENTETESDSDVQ